MNRDALIAILPLLGVVIGASLQHLLSRVSENRRALLEQRTRAYLDFLRSVAGIAHLGSMQEIGQADRLFTEAADAKTRICLYAPKGVVRALAEFERSEAILGSVEARSSFVELLHEMRRDIRGKKDLGEEYANIHRVLFQKDAGSPTE